MSVDAWEEKTTNIVTGFCEEKMFAETACYGCGVFNNRHGL